MSDFEAFRFRGQDILNGIYDIKKQQREITFYFLLVLAALLGSLRIANDSNSFEYSIGAIILILWVLSTILLFRLHASLRGIRKKLLIIWRSDHFKAVKNSGALFSDEKTEEAYEKATNFIFEYWHFVMIMMVPSLLVTYFLLDEWWWISSTVCILVLCASYVHYVYGIKKLLGAGFGRFRN
jgi:hypothetical protein